jgi:hypothetical protein
MRKLIKKIALLSLAKMKGHFLSNFISWLVQYIDIKAAIGGKRDRWEIELSAIGKKTGNNFYLIPRKEKCRAFKLHRLRYKISET